MSDIDAPVVPNRTWIDAVLVVGGATTAVAVSEPLVAVPPVVLGLVLPALRWSGRRRRGERLLELAPGELVSAHRELAAAARLPGVPDGDALIAGADGVVREVVAVVGARGPSGAAQRRFVQVRVDALRSVAADARERHAAWRAACEELDLRAETDVSPTSERQSHPLAVVLLVLLFPVFLAWDTARGLVRGAIALVDGLALRVRTACLLVVRAVVDAARRWRVLRRQVVAAAADARARFLAMRFR